MKAGMISIAALLVLLTSSWCSNASIPEATVFTAQKILTMDPQESVVDAVAVVDERIAAVGSLENIEKALSGYQLVTDSRFADKILMPGFIDNHLHPALAGLLLPSEFITPWDWDLPSQKVKGVQGRDAYLARLSELEQSLADPDEFLITWGYHQYFHGEISRQDINRISPKRPVVVWHRSFHEVYLNDAAIKALGIREEDVIDHPAIDFNRGHFYETGLFEVFPKLAPIVLNPQRFSAGIVEGLEQARRNGITTMADQGVPLMDLDSEMALLDAAIKEKKLPLRMLLVGNAASLVKALGEQGAFDAIESLPERNTAALTYLPGQVKLFADGAFYSQLMQMREGYLDGHHGEWIMQPEEMTAIARRYWREGYQLHIHVNGDEGLRVVLDMLETLQKELPRKDHRTVLHHFGYSGADQIPRVAASGALVSANPYYLWALGDKYSEVGLGPDRAHYITRLGSLEKNGISLSFHSDLPMAPAAPLTLAGIAASRVTATGAVLAPEEKLSVDTALRGITLEAARAIQQEDEIGSIEVGKRADFTVLEQDPLTVSPEKWREIPVWGTVLGGKVFPRH